jgi:hypothetical protein
MRKTANKRPSDDECRERLQATANSLTKEGASTFDVVTAFIDVATQLAQRDPAYAIGELDILADTFASGQAMTRLVRDKLAQKKGRKKKSP